MQHSDEDDEIEHYGGGVVAGGHRRHRAEREEDEDEDEGGERGAVGEEEEAAETLGVMSVGVASPAGAAPSGPASAAATGPAAAGGSARAHSSLPQQPQQRRVIAWDVLAALCMDEHVTQRLASAGRLKVRDYSPLHTFAPLFPAHPPPDSISFPTMRFKIGTCSNSPRCCVTSPPARHPALKGAFPRQRR